MGILRNTALLTFIGAKSVYNIGKGVLNTASDALAIAKDVVDGDFEGAFDKTGRRIEKTVTAGVNSIGAAVKVVDHGIECLSDKDKTFLDKETVNNLTAVTAAFIVGDVVGNAVLGDSDDAIADDTSTAVSSPSGLLPNGTDVCAISDNGCFEGDTDDLNTLISMGQVEGTDHIDSDDETRSLTARNEFLASHGYSGVPEGYEVHHIVPLCEGGADSPDNMILVSESDHDAITAAHARFYGWHEKA